VSTQRPEISNRFNGLLSEIGRKTVQTVPEIMSGTLCTRLKPRCE
jgi:hypothetical protein